MSVKTEISVTEAVYNWLMTQDVGLRFNHYDVLNHVDTNSGGAVSGAMHRLWNEGMIRVSGMDGKMYIWELVRKMHIGPFRKRPDRTTGYTRGPNVKRTQRLYAKPPEPVAPQRDVLTVATELGMDLKAGDPREKLSTKLLEIAVKLESMGL